MRGRHARDRAFVVRSGDDIHDAFETPRHRGGHPDLGVSGGRRKPFGRRGIAQRSCATCHAIADGESPLTDAPPFARLQFRYGPGGLAELLEKGMVKDRPRPLEEGGRPLHPRMPAFPLDDDEVLALAEYLQSFEASKAGPRRR